MWFVRKTKLDEVMTQLHERQLMHDNLLAQHRELAKAHLEQEVELDRLRLQIQNLRQTTKQLEAQLILLKQKG